MTASLAHGGQPLFTDDAAVVATKTCQLEAWVLSNHDSRDYVAQPACNFTGNLELSVGAARSRLDEGDSFSLIQLQAKTVLFTLHDDAWSFGAVAGAGRDTAAPHGSSAFQAF